MPDNYDPILAGDTLSDSRTKITNRDDTLRELFFAPTAPTLPTAYMLWADTATTLLKIRNAGNSAWITLGTLADNLGHLETDGTGVMTGTLNFGTNRGINVVDPVGPQDIATKNYHDLNSSGAFAFHSELQYTQAPGVQHSATFANVAKNVGFNLVAGGTQLSVLNSGLYLVKCTFYKSGFNAIGSNFRIVSTGPTNLIFMGSSDSGSSSCTNSRMLQFVAGEIYDFEFGPNGNSANGIINSNITILYIGP